MLELYDDLMAVNASPVVQLNRAVAVAKVHGAAAGLAAVPESARLKSYYLYLAVRGHLLAEVGRKEEAEEAYRAALVCPCSEPERRFLAGKLAAVQVGQNSEARR